MVWVGSLMVVLLGPFLFSVGAGPRSNSSFWGSSAKLLAELDQMLEHLGAREYAFFRKLEVFNEAVHGLGELVAVASRRHFSLSEECAFGAGDILDRLGRLQEAAEAFEAQIREETIERSSLPRFKYSLRALEMLRDPVVALAETLPCSPDLFGEEQQRHLADMCQQDWLFRLAIGEASMIAAGHRRDRGSLAQLLGQVSRARQAQGESQKACARFFSGNPSSLGLGYRAVDEIVRLLSDKAHILACLATINLNPSKSWRPRLKKANALSPSNIGMELFEILTRACAEFVQLCLHQLGGLLAGISTWPSFEIYEAVANPALPHPVQIRQAGHDLVSHLDFEPIRQFGARLPPATRVMHHLAYVVDCAHKLSKNSLSHQLQFELCAHLQYVHAAAEAAHQALQQSREANDPVLGTRLFASIVAASWTVLLLHSAHQQILPQEHLEEMKVCQEFQVPVLGRTTGKSARTYITKA